MKFFILFAFVAATVIAHSADAPSTNVEKIIAPPPLVPLAMRASGRILVIDEYKTNHRALYRFQWPGTYLAAAFNGTEVYFETGPGDAILHLLIDDQPAFPLVKPGVAIFRIGGLSDGDHTIRIEYVTENQGAPVDFKGFLLASGRPAILPPQAGRQIEFIGDSHTVGYGNTSTKRQCTSGEVWATTDNSQAFGALTAKHYQADYQINAISGRGIVRSYNGANVDSLPAVYPYLLFDKKNMADDPVWQPQIIVVALGTNDFSTPLHDGEKWKTRAELCTDFERGYVRFVQQLRQKDPGAFFILAANDAASGEIQAEVRKVIDQLQVLGEKRAAFVPFNNLELTGCDWHPSLADHKMMARVLEQFIDARPELWHGH